MTSTYFCVKFIFFDNRTHQTEVGFCLSDVPAMIIGIIQGSGIGLVMFNVYCNAQWVKIMERSSLWAVLTVTSPYLMFTIDVAVTSS